MLKVYSDMCRQIVRWMLLDGFLRHVELVSSDAEETEAQLTALTRTCEFTRTSHFSPTHEFLIRNSLQIRECEGQLNLGFFDAPWSSMESVEKETRVSRTSVQNLALHQETSEISSSTYT